MKPQPFQQHGELDQLLHHLNLSTFKIHYQKMSEDYEKNGLGYLHFLYDLCLRESEKKDQLRQERLIKSAKLPRHKVLKDFEIKRIPGLSPALITRLATGAFMDVQENILIFGNPGTGKTHLSIALAREWCLLGRKVLFKSVSKLVEELRQAYAKASLHKYIKQLDRIECLIIDDISYVPLQRDEADLLFQLINERYEQRSLMITSNLPFSQWKSIFVDEMSTIALVDRLIHHAEILELNATSYRAETAKDKKLKEKNTPNSKKSMT